MGQCLRPMVSQEREGSRSRSNGTFGGITSEGKSAAASSKQRRSGGCSSIVALDEVLRRIEDGNSFTPIESPFLPGLATASHVEMSVFPSSQRYRVKEPTRAGVLWAHQLLRHENMGQAVTYQLWIRPFLGPNADNVIVYLLECDEEAVADFVVKGVEEDGLLSLMPQSIRDLRHFLSICLQITFTATTATQAIDLENASVVEEGLNGQEQDNASITTSTLSEEPVEDACPPSLLFYAQREVISHLDLARKAATSTTPLPLHIQRDIFGQGRFVTVNVFLWPRSTYIPTADILVQEGMLVCEFVHLLRQKAGIPSDQKVVLYHRFRMLHGCNEITDSCSQIDAFVPPSEVFDPVASSQMSVVLSLFGVSMSDVTVGPAMRMKEFDSRVRNLFGLREDSFLVYLPDGHYTPPYTTCSGWKCVHPFSVQPVPRSGTSIRQSLRRRRSSVADRLYSSADNILLDRSAPQRRSLYAPRDGQASGRRSAQGNNSSSGGGGTRGGGGGGAVSVDAAQQRAEASALQMLSSPGRHFPCKTRGDCESDIPMYRLHHEMSMYQLTVEQYGISPHSIVQVYEVTGPAVSVSSCRATQLSTTKGQRGNLMDVNPTWSLFTFAHYFDAMMSPSAVYLDKQVRFGGRCVQVSECQDRTLESLFAEWSPVWWNRRGHAARELTRKDLLLNHFLTIQTAL